MKTLEEEAKQSTQVLIEYEYFIRGARSKWVESEKIKAQIDVLYQTRNSGLTSAVFKIEKLEQQLKELQQ
jgi:hypothetical protein